MSAEGSTSREIPKWWSLDSLVRAVVLVAGGCIIVASLRAASVVLAPLMTALFLTAVLAAPVLWLVQKRLPYRIAVAVVALLTVGSIVGLVFLIQHWTQTIQAQMPGYTEEAAQSLSSIRDWLQEAGFAELMSSAAETMREQWVVPLGTGAFRLITGTVFVLVLVGFLMAEVAGLQDKLEVAFEGDARVRSVRRVGARLMAYFRIKSVTSFATGVIAGFACFVAGVDLPVLWGLIAFLFNFAPTIGSLVAAIPPVAFALLFIGWETALGLGLAYLAINLAIGAVLEPRMLGYRMNLSPLVILLSLVFWGWVWGAIGLLLAVPITVLIKLLIEQTDGLRPIAVMLGPGRRFANAAREHGDESGVPEPKTRD